MGDEEKTFKMDFHVDGEDMLLEIVEDSLPEDIEGHILKKIIDNYGTTFGIRGDEDLESKSNFQFEFNFDEDKVSITCLDTDTEELVTFDSEKDPITVEGHIMNNNELKDIKAKVSVDKL